MSHLFVIDNEEYDETRRLNKLFELEHEEGAVDFEWLSDQLQVVDAVYERVSGVKQ